MGIGAGVRVWGCAGAQAAAGERFPLHTASTFDNYLLDAAVSFSSPLKSRA